MAITVGAPAQVARSRSAAFPEAVWLGILIERAGFEPIRITISVLPGFKS